MDRRSMLRSLFGLAGAIALFRNVSLGKSGSTPGVKRVWFNRELIYSAYSADVSKVGFITVRGPQANVARAVVFLNGKDVSNDCFAADDIAGYVDLDVKDERGKYVIKHSPECTDPTGTWRRYAVVSADRFDGSNKMIELHRNCNELASKRLYGNVEIRAVRFGPRIESTPISELRITKRLADQLGMEVIELEKALTGYDANMRASLLKRVNNL